MLRFSTKKLLRLGLLLAICLIAVFSPQELDNNQQPLLLSDKILVKKVIDGDTIELSNGKKVRYIGIDTPEMGTKKTQAACYAEKAKAENEKLVLNRQVRLEKDVSETDKYQRLLRYVYFLDKFGKETMVNEYLVRWGFATIATYPPDVKYVELFKAAQKEARQQNLGLWQECVKIIF